MTKKQNTNLISKNIMNFFQKIHSNVLVLNSSKIFAGFMIIVLNISSRFVTIKLSKSMESYLKYTFSKQILIFAIAWMGTRDIYIALVVAILFTIFMDVLFNEDSYYCVLPSSFTEYHMKLSENDTESNDITRGIPGMPPPTSGATNKTPSKNNESNPVEKKDQLIGDEEIEKALSILKKAKEQNTMSLKDEFYNNYYTSS